MSLGSQAKRGQPEPSGLIRPRLLSVLVGDDAPDIVVIVAPPGAGKTTLLARAAALTPTPVAWCTLTPAHRDRVAFLATVTRALAHASGTVLSDHGDQADLERLLARAPTAWLVLDDVHVLRGSPGEAALAELLDRRSPGLRVAMATRRLPAAIDVPALMVAGQLVEIDADDLRFRSWEVEELFRVVYEEPLPPEAAAALTRRSGGWAAGLMLFHLSVAGKSATERRRAVDALGGRSRLLRSYLTRTVLDELEAERREFLLTTCTLGLLTGPLCDELLGRKGSGALLEEIADRQFFLSRAADGRSYRYHQVLQDLLEGLLIDELGAAAATRLYARSAHLLERRGHLREALRAYTMAEDFASVARLLQVTSDVTSLEDVQAVDDDPWVALVRARRLLRAGSIEAAVRAFRRVEEAWEDAELRARCSDERVAAAVWLPTPPPPATPGSGRLVGEWVRAATRHAVVVEEAVLSPLAAGVGLLLRGEPEEAARRLRGVTDGAGGESLFGDLARVVAELACGREPAMAMTTLEELVLTAEVEQQPWVARMARGLQSSMLLVLRPDEWRVESCESLVEECARAGDRWGSLLLSGALGVALALRGDPAAGPCLDRATAEAESLQAPVLAAWARTIQAVHARRVEDPQAEDWERSATQLARGASLPTLLSLVAELLGPHLRGGRPQGTVQVRCLGTFGIQVAGRELVLPGLRPRPKSLLMLLALHHGRAVHKEVLIDLLWPDVTVEVAAHRLHAAVSCARRSLSEAGLGTDRLQCSGSAYRLQLPDAEVDLVEFDRRVRAAARAGAAGDHQAEYAAALAALELYGGELLSDAGPAEWLLAERERLRTTAASIADTAARLALGLRTPAAALPLAHRVIELEPLRDSGWALLAEIQERMGDRGAAAATRRGHGVEDVAQRLG